MTYRQHAITAPLAGLVLSLLLAACSDGSKPTSAVEQGAAATASSTRDAVAIARGKIDVQGGLLELAVPADGVVASVAVKEGDSVKKGQQLVHLSSDAAQLDVELAKAELQRAQAEQKTQEIRLPVLKEQALRLAEAARAGASDRLRADEALQSQQQVESAVVLARADVAIQKQKLAVAQHQLGLRNVSAPVDGSIVRLNVQPGQRVRADQSGALLVLLPNRPLIVRAELNESFASRIKLGMRADVVMESDPRAAALPARLVRISQVYGASKLNDGTEPRTNVRVIECFLEFEQVQTLRIGQNVRVSFHD
jgi:multidrug efflux pump subunit AcrA (membrane-fusion protein)